MRGPAIIVPAVVLATLAVTGCATKQFVREEVRQSEARSGAAISRLDTEVGQDRARLTGLATEVTDARVVADEASRRAGDAAIAAGTATAQAEEAAGKAAEATARADQASSLASQALARTEQTDQRLTRLWANRDKRQVADTVFVRFAFDKWHLDDSAQTALLDVLRQLTENPDLFVQLEGYTDSSGPEAYNHLLSQRRAESVRRFLVQKGVDLYRIHSIGLGDVNPLAGNQTKQGREQNRRVAVKLLVAAD